MSVPGLGIFSGDFQVIYPGLHGAPLRHHPRPVTCDDPDFATIPSGKREAQSLFQSPSTQLGLRHLSLALSLSRPHRRLLHPDSCILRSPYIP